MILSVRGMHQQDASPSLFYAVFCISVVFYVTSSLLLLHPFIYRYEDESARDDEGENERPVDALGADQYQVAEEDPEVDEEDGLGTGHL